MSISPHGLDALVHRLSLHGLLEPEDEAAVLALPHSLRDLERDHYLVQEGDKPTHSCLVVSGFAISHKISSDGARQIVNFHLTGDMVDLQNSFLPVADHNVQALTKMRAAFIPREAILHLAFSRPPVGKALWLETLAEGSISREWIMNVGRRNALQRTAHLLCEFAYRLYAVRVGTECSYELPMTQDQLADTLSLTAVHVNRMLKALDAAGLTKRTGRSVTICDLKKLAELGDFRSTYLHLPHYALPDYMQ